MSDERTPIEVISNLTPLEVSNMSVQCLAYHLGMSQSIIKLAQADIEKLKKALEEIEVLCDNQNQTHGAIWHVVYNALNPKPDDST